MAPVSTSVPAAVVLKAVRGWRLFPCRTEVDRAVMAGVAAGGRHRQPLADVGCGDGRPGGRQLAVTAGSRPDRLGLPVADRHARAQRTGRIGPCCAVLHRRHVAPVGHGTQQPGHRDRGVGDGDQRTAARPAGARRYRSPAAAVRLGLLQQGPWVLCAVADPGNAVPVPRTPGSLAEAGRGLQMICAFSDLWGYTTPSEAGKVVWAMFTARHAPPSPARNPGRPGRDPVPGTAR